MPAMPRVPTVPQMPKLPSGGAKVIIPMIIVGLIYGVCWYLKVDQRTTVLYIMLGVVFWLLILGIQKLLAIRAAKKIERQLREQAEAQLRAAGGESKSEIEALNQKFNEALAMLKASRMGKSALYTLPWYVIIGAPGSGKTTCIQESGLNFPAMGSNPSSVRGVGGTRNCDWWFTDEAIFLDTAGRYTTDTDDLDEWASFLDLVRKTRTHTPLNGAIVVVSVQDLIVMGEDDIAAYAKTIRDRIDELSAKLEVVFPVYLVFAKCDMLQGFGEFFEHLNKNDREKAWGWTLPYDKNQPRAATDLFSEQFQVLVDALSVQRIPALVMERPPEKKERVFLFPRQFILAHRPLVGFIDTLWRPNPFQETALLRGVYFTSATQKGTPIDQLSDGKGEDAFSMLKTIPSLPSQAEEKKSYFVHDLFEDIIIPDQTLVRTSTRKMKRLNITRWSAAGVAGAFFGTWLVMLVLSFFLNQQLIADTRKATVEVNNMLVGANSSTSTNSSGTPGSVSAAADSDDAMRNLNLLDALRQQLTTLRSYNAGELPMSYGWGLYQGREIEREATRVYVRWCRRLFLEPIQPLLEAKLRQQKSESKDALAYDMLYDNYRAYSMIGGRLPLRVDPGPLTGNRDPEKISREQTKSLLQGVLGADWRIEAMQGLTEEKFRLKELQDLQRLASDLLEFFLELVTDPNNTKLGEEWNIKLDDRLTNDIMLELRDGYWIIYSYDDLIKGRGSDEGVGMVDRDFLVATAGRENIELDPAATFTRLYTESAYTTEIVGQLQQRAATLSLRFKSIGVDVPQSQIEDKLIDRYAKEYSNHWRELMRNVKIKPFTSVTDAAANLRTLSDPETSPLRIFLRNVWTRRTIHFGRESPPDQVPSDKIDEWLPEVIKALGEFSKAIGNFDRSKPGDNGYRVLQRIEGTGGFNWTVNTDQLKALTEAFNKAHSDFEEKLRPVDGQYKDSVNSLLESLLSSTSSAIVAESQTEADNFWRVAVYDVFQLNYANKFPFSEANNPEDVTMSVFGNMFSPDRGIYMKAAGLINKLQNQAVDKKPMVSASEDWTRAHNAAVAIRSACFQSPQDPGKVSINFDCEFRRYTDVTDVILVLEGNEMKMSRTPPDNQNRQLVHVVWNESATPKGAKLRFEFVGPPNDNARQSEIKSPWGLLRILRYADGGGEPTRGKPNEIRFAYTFTDVKTSRGKIEGALVITSTGPENPFTRDRFRKFSCPTKVGN